MKRIILVLLAGALGVAAEPRTLTLREAVAAAISQNPDLVIARFDQAKAKYAVQIAHDPFVPKIFGGSGAAWTTGFPASINGQPPSIFEAQTVMAVYNRPQAYKVAEARENVRTAELGVEQKRDEAAYRAASLWLDAQQMAEAAEIAHRQVDHLKSLRETTQARLAEGRALPVDLKQAEFDYARAMQRAEALTADQEIAESSLAVILGFPPEDRVAAARQDRMTAEVPASEETSIENAIANSREMKILQSKIQAKGIELRGYKSARYPVVDLVAQYNLLAQYNFNDFYRRFQRHNGQLGASVTIPLLVGSATRGYLGQAESELARMQAEVNHMRSQITVNTRRDHQLVRKAENARTVARADLELHREKLTVILAQFDEGRVGLKEVEQARIAESEKWIQYYESQHNLERVKLNLLRGTGMLIAAMQ